MKVFSDEQLARPDHVAQIAALATCFRSALEELRSQLGGLGLNLERFPCGCCGNVSPILGTYLTENGCGRFELIEGTRGVHEHDFRSHAWLSQGRLIVDITADQCPEVGERVIVTTESPWHDTFTQRVGYSGDYRSVGNPELTKIMEAVYGLVVRHIAATAPSRQARAEE